MLKKIGKPLSILLGTLFFVVIASGIWYFAANHSQRNAEPVKIYRVTQPEKKPVSDTTPSSVQTDTENASNQPETSKTKGGQTNATPMSTSSDTIDVSAPSDKLSAQSTEASNSTSQRNDEELRKERRRQRIAEIEDDIRRNKDLLEKLENKSATGKTSTEELEARRLTLARELNALSAEEQRAYFDKQAANVARIISEYHEKLRTTKSISDSGETNQLIQSLQQTLPELSHEEYMQRNIDSLREYGFEPKF